MIETPNSETLPISRRRKRGLCLTSRRAAKRIMALFDSSTTPRAEERIIRNTLMTDISIITTTTDTQSDQSNDPRGIQTEQEIAFEALMEWNARPIAHRPQMEKKLQCLLVKSIYHYHIELRTI